MKQPYSKSYGGKTDSLREVGYRLVLYCQEVLLHYEIEELPFDEKLRTDEKHLEEIEKTKDALQKWQYALAYPDRKFVDIVTELEAKQGNDMILWLDEAAFELPIWPTWTFFQRIFFVAFDDFDMAFNELAP